jgi:hypothetical protein
LARHADRAATAQSPPRHGKRAVAPRRGADGPRPSLAEWLNRANFPRTECRTSPRFTLPLRPLRFIYRSHALGLFSATMTPGLRLGRALGPGPNSGTHDVRTSKERAHEDPTSAGHSADRTGCACRHARKQAVIGAEQGGAANRSCRNHEGGDTREVDRQEEAGQEVRQGQGCQERPTADAGQGAVRRRNRTGAAQGAFDRILREGLSRRRQGHCGRWSGLAGDAPLS